MVSGALLILGPLWIHSLIDACDIDKLDREVVLLWFRERVLEDLGLEEPPVVDAAQPGLRHTRCRVPRASRTTWVNHQTPPIQDTFETILFPTSDSACARNDSAPEKPTTRHFTYHFQPVMKLQEAVLTSAHFWFFVGEGDTTNISASLFIITSAQQLLLAAEFPSTLSSDGWSTFNLDQSLLASMADGPFRLQVHCDTCRCHDNEDDKMPFLDLYARPRGPVRSRRHAALTIPWSPSAIDLLQRPSQERPQHSDCHRAEININFAELGWDHWIIYPSSLTFYYCHGNCRIGNRTATSLGITQCCAPVPGTMKSLRVTTTSDGGYTFNYETLPNIMPEECTCI